ncbi:putative methionine--tRNA ligase [Iris pallida]|uniref:Methionine--tRNA ligase n=1 Tax=Iris pallida TaxID=29817 RepID=A0AAX6G2Y4_IRIPA|nr:putative methionine--tRNA ligase [Iris pallida]
MKPTTMRGIKSHAMVLAASSDDHTKDAWQKVDPDELSYELCMCPWLCRLKIEQVTTQFHHVKCFVCWMKDGSRAGFARVMS